MEAMLAVDMIREGSRATAALHPMRRRILETLSRPNSAAGVARRLGLPRQKVNYHLRLLEGERLTVETEVRFASPERQHAFATELLEAVTALARKYHDDDAPNGRSFRFFTGGYPARPESAATEPQGGGDT